MAKIKDTFGNTAEFETHNTVVYELGRFGEFAITYTYHCSECGNEVEWVGLTADEVMACADHPTAQIDSVATDKRGQQFSRKRVVTDTYNTGYGSGWVNGDDTGNTYRLILDGVKSNHVAIWNEAEKTYKIDSLLSLKPIGELLS